MPTTVIALAAFAAGAVAHALHQQRIRVAQITAIRSERARAQSLRDAYQRGFNEQIALRLPRTAPSHWPLQDIALETDRAAVDYESAPHINAYESELRSLYTGKRNAVLDALSMRARGDNE